MQTCYPVDIITGTMKISADIGIIAWGQGSQFKQQISSGIASMFSMNDSDVTITTYQSGSIIVSFLVACPDFSLMNSAEDTLDGLGGKQFMVTYNGVNYPATFTNYARLPFDTPEDQTDRVSVLLKVILIPILGFFALCAIVAVIVFCSLQHCRDGKTRLSESQRNSVSFDTVEKGGLKAGYNNPAYEETKDEKKEIRFNPPTIKSITSA
jgi:hypothetical protein